jgi:hypothetical protein
MKDFNILKLNLKEEIQKETELNNEEDTSLDYVKNPREGEAT